MIYIRTSRNAYFRLSYSQGKHSIILRIIRLISHKLEVFKLLAEIMRVEEKSFCTPRSHGGGFGGKILLILSLDTR
jgi:hypothetical protein